MKSAGQSIHCFRKIGCRKFHTVSYSSEAIKVQGLEDIFRKEKEITYMGKKSDWPPRRSDGKATGRLHPTWWAGPGVSREGGPSPPAPCPGGRQTHHRGLGFKREHSPGLWERAPPLHASFAVTKLSPNSTAVQFSAPRSPQGHAEQPDQGPAFGLKRRPSPPAGCLTPPATPSSTHLLTLPLRFPAAQP